MTKLWTQDPRRWRYMVFDHDETSYSGPPKKEVHSLVFDHDENYGLRIPEVGGTYGFFTTTKTMYSRPPKKEVHCLVFYHDETMYSRPPKKEVHGLVFDHDENFVLRTPEEGGSDLPGRHGYANLQSYRPGHPARYLQDRAPSHFRYVFLFERKNC